MTALTLKRNTSSEDAKTFAPCSCAAETTVNNSAFSGIAVAMSVLLCICAINVFDIYGIIIGIIIRNIITKNQCEKTKC